MRRRARREILGRGFFIGANLRRIGGAGKPDPAWRGAVHRGAVVDAAPGAT
jgi:hypothetical protein